MWKIPLSNLNVLMGQSIINLVSWSVVTAVPLIAHGTPMLYKLVDNAPTMQHIQMHILYIVMRWIEKEGSSAFLGAW